MTDRPSSLADFYPDSSSTPRSTPPPAAAAPKLPPIGAERLIAAWLDGLSPDTIESYRFDMVAFSKFLGLPDAETAGKALLSRSNGEANLLALEFKNHMAKAGFAPATVNRRLAALRSFTRAARRVGMIPWVLEFDRIFLKPYKDTRGPGVAGVRKLLAAVATRTDAVGLRDRAMLRLLYERGLRAKEVCTLDLEHVDLERGALNILGKWRREREWVTLAPTTTEALAEWIAVRGSEHGPLFYHFRHGHLEGGLSRQGLYRVVRLLGDAVGIRARPHGLRHAAITAALDVGQDIRSVQRFARHCDLSTIAVYDDSRKDFGKQVTDAICEPEPGQRRPRRKREKNTAIVRVPKRPLLMHELGLKRGEANKNAKLTAADVVEIRRRHAGGEGTTALAREFGVSAANVQSIVTRKSWAHVS